MDNRYEQQPPDPGRHELPADPGRHEGRTERVEIELDRMVGVRLDADHFSVLGTLAAREGLTPTAMARVLLRRALREARRGLELGL